MAIKLVVTDLDGTLLTNDKQVPARNREVLEQVAAKGIQIVICTGRTLPGVQSILQALPFLNQSDYMILQNGAQILRVDEAQSLVHQEVLDKVTRETALAYAKQFEQQEAQLVAFDRDHLYLIGAPVANHFVERDAAFLNTAITLMSEAEFLAHEGLIKTMILAPETVLDELESLVTPIQRDTLSLVRSQRIILEFLPKGVSKASGLDYLVKLLGFTADEVLALGDELNDVEMLQYAGTAVVMANGPKQVQQLADFVTLSNEEAGVAHALETLILAKT